MKSRTKRLLLVLGCLLLLGSAGAVWSVYSSVSQRLDLTRKRNEADTRMLKQVRLAPIPASAQQVAVLTTGATLVWGRTFAHSFEMSFLAPPADIEHWLQQSPGTREAVPTTASPRRRHFEIAPNGLIGQAAVTVDDAQHCVTILVCQS